jgi:hypothetical protein
VDHLVAGAGQEPGRLRLPAGPYLRRIDRRGLFASIADGTLK